MKHILVTGGAGFVGSHLAIGLRRHFEGARVVALDNLKRRGSELNVPRLQQAGVEFLHGDIRQPSDIAAAGQTDLVVECSAEPSVLAGYGESPEYVTQTNLTGTLHCLEHARRHGAAVFFLSTSRVYPMAAIRRLRYRETETRFELDAEQDTPGASEWGISEAFPLEGPRSLYGATKLCSELMMLEYLDMYGLRGLINRCGVLTGPWQMGKADQGVAVLWMARHVFGGPLKYIGYGGQGRQVRDLLHVEDLLRLVLCQLGQLESLSGQIFNVGGGREVSLSLCEMTALCQKLTGTVLDISGEPAERPADIPLYLSDCRKVTQATGWRPEHSATQIMGDIFEWMDSRREQLCGFLSGTH